MRRGPKVTTHAVERYIERIHWLPAKQWASDRIIDGYFEGYLMPWEHSHQRWNQDPLNYSREESGTRYHLTPSMVLFVCRGQVRTLLRTTTDDLATALTFLLTRQWIDDCEDEDEDESAEAA